MAYAAIKDVEKRYHPLDSDEKTKCEALLEDASTLIASEFKNRGYDVPSSQDKNEALKVVACAIVIRALSANTQADITNTSVTAGPFSESVTFATRDGSLYLKSSELKMLGLAQAGRLYSVEVC